MGINAINGADEMNKVTESVATDVAIAPAVDEVISLRRAARELARFAPSKKGEKVADEKLLQLLKAGKVRAGFHAPGGDMPVWVQLPGNYWLNVSSASFKKIRVEQSANRKGEYKVRLSSFPSEYAAIRSAADTPPLSATALLLEFLRYERDLFEVMLPSREWDEFKKQLPEPVVDLVQDDENTGKGGRGVLKTWKEVNAILAAYLLKRNIKSSDDESCEAIANNILEIARKTDPSWRLPAPGTMEKEVARVLALIDTPEFMSISSINSFRS